MSDESTPEVSEIEFASPVLGDAEETRVRRALESCWLTTGPKTDEFERTIARGVEARHAVGTNNCTAALYLALRALDIDGEVITSPFTFASTVSSCLLAGATPVLADVRPETLTLDPDAVRAALTDETEAILPVHYAGQGTDLDALSDIATEHELSLIEDAAHALGGSYEGDALGTIGDAGCYSFYATKTITTGEGGMLVTDDDDVAETARRLRLAGVDKDSWARETDETAHWTYDVRDVSLKFNMNDIQASIGLAQVEKLEDFVAQRRRIADQYDDALSSISGLQPLAVRDPDEHARHLYPVFVAEDEFGISRDALLQRLAENGIGTGVHYVPIQYHSAFDDIGRTSLDVTEEVFPRLCSLPLHADMTRADVETVVDVLSDLGASA